MASQATRVVFDSSISVVIAHGLCPARVRGAVRFVGTGQTG
jgi:hypothetical protein